ncbi:MAG: GNAT family N-acetyltransferase [Peptostreptococcaceae bacterium]
MNLQIKKISKNNYEEILKLQVSKEQEGFIESIEECLEEANQDSKWREVGIYDEDVPVGFAMYALFKDEGEHGRVWLDRFLIDEKYQGKGYGKVGVITILKQLYREYNHTKIYLSVYDNNECAISLYEKIGFEFNGEVDTKGERVMLIDLKEVIDG